MAELDGTVIHQLLAEIGRRSGQPAQLLLLGGSALCLLGSSRPTLDIDYVGDDLHKSELQHLIDRVAIEQGLEVEAVPIEQFIPVPADAPTRHLLVGHFANLEVHVFDPFTIALSKLDRGFDTYIDDILFLLRQNLISLETLDLIVAAALEHAVEFSLNRSQTLTNLASLPDLTMPWPKTERLPGWWGSSAQHASLKRKPGTFPTADRESTTPLMPESLSQAGLLFALGFSLYPRADSHEWTRLARETA